MSDPNLDKEHKHPVKKHLRLQKAFWYLAEVLFGPVLRLVLNFHCKTTRPKAKTFLALCNHNNDLDCISMAIGLWRHMRFVASANILSGFAGKLVALFLGPIPRRKGARADDTVELILENLKDGISVGMMPEGNRSWDGETMFIPKRTGAVVKASGAALVTYRIHGEFLKTPRYGKYTRKGPSSGELIREYSPEELSKMTVEEIDDAIANDLYVNAFEDQKTPPELLKRFRKKGQEMIRYRGKCRAESIESILYLCPACKRFGTLESRGNGFHCRACGLSGMVNEYGFLSGDLPYDTPVDWNHFQKAYVKAHAREFKEKTDAFFTDEGARFYEVLGNEKRLLFENASLTFYRDRIEIRGEKDVLTVPLSDVSRIGAFRSKRLLFTAGETYYEAAFPGIVSAVKYDALWRVLTGREYF